MHWCLSQPVPTSSGSVPSNITLSRFLVNSVSIILCLQMLLTNCLLLWTTCHFSCQQNLPLLSHLPWFALMIAVSSLMCHHFKNISVFAQRLRNHRLPCGRPWQHVLLGLAVTPAGAGALPPVVLFLGLDPCLVQSNVQWRGRQFFQVLYNWKCLYSTLTFDWWLTGYRILAWKKFSLKNVKAIII